MVFIANLQWLTLLVGPIDQSITGATAIQVVTIFVLTEPGWYRSGHLIDAGPRIMISGSGVLVAPRVINSVADSLFLCTWRGGRRHGAYVIYGGSVGNALKWFPDRVCRGPDRSWLRSRVGADGDPDCQHDPVERQAAFPGSVSGRGSW